MIYKNIKERHEHKIEILSNKIDELEKQLESYSKLQSEVHFGIERVWSIDTYPSLNSDGGDTKLLKKLKKERSEIIEEIFYKIANQWID